MHMCVQLESARFYTSLSLALPLFTLSLFSLILLSLSYSRSFFLSFSLSLFSLSLTLSSLLSLVSLSVLSLFSPPPLLMAANDSPLQGSGPVPCASAPPSPKPPLH